MDRMDEVCWLVEEPYGEVGFRAMLDLLREDVPGACVVEHETEAYTVFSVMGSLPSLRAWANAGLPIYDISRNADELVEAFTSDPRP